jgi:3-hydroxyisobutyrate dehydrogenase
MRFINEYFPKKTNCNKKEVKECLLGKNNRNGILSIAKAGSLVIDCSTIDPDISVELNDIAKNKGIAMIDAPVSGGVNGADAGTLTFMVGGLDVNVEKARPLLEAMGKKIVHCGGPGTGGITKLCNNLALAIQMIGTAEALALGKKLGMDPKKLSEVMSTSTARCWSVDTYNPCPGVMENVPSSRNYEGGFSCSLMEKDIGLAIKGIIIIFPYILIAINIFLNSWFTCQG